MAPPIRPQVGGSEVSTSSGSIHTKMGDTTVGSDGSVFTQMGDFSSDGSTRMGNTATGLGAVFNEHKQDRFGFDSSDKW